MFWTRFYELCIDKGSKPNPIGEELGLSSGVLTNWKNGISYPKGETLIDIAKYFNCSVDYLVGLSDFKKVNSTKLSATDIDILEKLHSLPPDELDEILHILNYKYENKVNLKSEIEKENINDGTNS